MGLTLKPEKCRFAYEELKFLGHVVNTEGFLPDPERTSAIIANFPRPKDKTGVRTALRRKLCTHCGATHVLDERQRYFQLGGISAGSVLRASTSPPEPACARTFLETEMHTDASDVGLDAVLVQKQSGCGKVIACSSRGFSKEEKNYSASEKDCLAII